MRRSRTNLVTLVLTLTAVLVPGAAVFASARPAAADCVNIPAAPTELDLARIRVIVIGVVHEEHGGGLARIEPEAFLKGAASREPIRPRYPENDGGCAPAALREGARVVAFLTATQGVLDWPFAGQVFWLQGGAAVSGGSAPVSTTEQALVQNVRGVTGQFALPAANGEEGANIDWVGTVAPVGAALLVIFGIGLVLMRIWHRIDPS